MKPTCCGESPEVLVGWKLHRTRLRDALLRFRRRYIPYLVWWGDEIDARVMLKENKLQPIECADVEGAVMVALQQLQRGTFFEVEKHLREVGIKFDTSIGSEGRGWEWDWSLRGPISVTFRGRASKPERRE